MEVHRAFDEVGAALTTEGQDGHELAGEIMRHARFRANDAWLNLRRRGPRLRLWCAWVRQTCPTTQTIECPIDVGALMQFAATPAAFTRDGERGKTYLELIEELLGATRFEDDHTGWITLRYTFSKMGARLAAAGFVRYSREYAAGQDPFKLPKMVRKLALGRFGLDFDDAASYPTAAAAMFTEGAQISQLFLAGREAIMAEHGRFFFDVATHSDEERPRHH